MINLLNKIQSSLDISNLWGLPGGVCFTSSNYPKCKLICTSGNFGLVKKSPTSNYGWRKQSKHIFDLEKRFEFRRFRDIRVRDIESWLYLIQRNHHFKVHIASITKILKGKQLFTFVFLNPFPNKEWRIKQNRMNR